MRFSIATTVAFIAGAYAQYGADYGTVSAAAATTVSLTSDLALTSAAAATVSAAAVSTCVSESFPTVTVPAAPSGEVPVQQIKVSNKNGSLTFSPPVVVAPEGTMIQFLFYPKVCFTGLRRLHELGS
jgi:hypothetical protein